MTARGYTLLETLVALAITGVVLAAVAGTVRRAAVARARATAEADRIGVARTLLLRLAAEIEAAHAPEGSSFEPFAVDVPARGRPWARLRLATGAPADLHALVYGVEPDDRRPGAGVLVRADALPGASEARGQAVLDGVHAFRVRCFDGATWQTTCSGRLPHAVEIGLALDDGRGGVEELAVTVAPAAAS